MLEHLNIKKIKRNIGGIMLKKRGFLILFLIFSVSMVWGQTSLYSDDFTGEDSKGQIGSTNNVTGVAWNIEVSEGSFEDNDDFFAVKNGVFEAQDIDGTCYWTSKTFNISRYSFLHFSLDAKASGDFEASGDVFDVEIVSDETTETLFTGVVDEDVSGDPMFFGSTKLTGTLQTFSKGISTTGSSAYIKITANNNAGDELYGWDNLVLTGSNVPPPSNLSIDLTTSDKMNITWTKPSGTHGTDWDGVLVFVSNGSNGIDLSQSGEDGNDYTAKLNYGDGTSATDAGSNDNAYCVANQTTDSDGDITVTGLTDRDTYYVYAYAYKEVAGDNNDDEWSSQADGGSDVAEVPEISDFTVIPGDQQLDLSWTNPSGTVTDWWDKVIIVAREGSAVEAAISKANFDGLADILVTAESDWAARSDANDVYDLSNNQIGTDNTNYFVYNGTSSSVTITGLTNGNTYYFKTMVYYEDESSSDVWSSGVTGNGTSNSLVINEILADPNGDANGDANGDGTTNTTDDEFVEIVNTGDESVDVSGYKIYDGYGLRHTVPSSTVIDAGVALVVFGGGNPTGIPGIVQTASSNALELNNSGDDVILKDDNDNILASYTYGSEGGDDQSLARNPDFTGNFVKHTTISGNSVSFSPGRKNSDDSSLPITLSTFTVVFVDEQPLLQWKTQSEENNAGWNIYRGETETAFQAETAQIVNFEIIPGAGTSTEPTTYEYSDVFPVQPESSYYYWLESVDYSGTTHLYGPVTLEVPEDDIPGDTPDLPLQYGMQNYPNPFNPSTEISFVLPKASPVELNIYNLKGRKIRTLIAGETLAKDKLHKVVWDGTDSSGQPVSSGIYLYKLLTQDKVYTQKMLLVK
jgi:hypothetical protein